MREVPIRRNAATGEARRDAGEHERERGGGADTPDDRCDRNEDACADDDGEPVEEERGQKASERRNATCAVGWLFFIVILFQNLTEFK